MTRAAEDVTYRGRRRWNGSHGKVWWDNELLFEIEKFECKVTANREDVIIGNSVDSKIVSLKGEGTITIKSVINRNISAYLEAWKSGQDPRATFVGLIEDPDAVDKQKERCSIDNVWFNELAIMNFEKGKVVEKEFPFGFTPEDASFMETIS
ncbi:terminase [Megasphaera cerevisiae DSM 20462]|uniref:Terminase n=1 Tax=Megasphaera cerevisiae DSM 20462 TaxID=1122219 RepID=A0A0J6WYA7_9FIRM|nr:phage tail tube protein [Megasphaera cerevisiae]KMO87228.1 terminase [Megasphaera cerevisiae DSM 20462]SJZ61204.1 Phage tail tube protein [Megasphaera cerevisiae DSM 20462]